MHSNAFVTFLCYYFCLFKHGPLFPLKIHKLHMLSHTQSAATALHISRSWLQNCRQVLYTSCSYQDAGNLITSAARRLYLGKFFTALLERPLSATSCFFSLLKHGSSLFALRDNVTSPHPGDFTLDKAAWLLCLCSLPFGDHGVAALPLTSRWFNACLWASLRLRPAGHQPSAPAEPGQAGVRATQRAEFRITQPPSLQARSSKRKPRELYAKLIISRTLIRSSPASLRLTKVLTHWLNASAA